jgi:hypothetical protein
MCPPPPVVFSQVPDKLTKTGKLERSPPQLEPRLALSMVIACTQPLPGAKKPAGPGPEALSVHDIVADMTIISGKSANINSAFIFPRSSAVPLEWRFSP